jgi:hypothetical protein
MVGRSNGFSVSAMIVYDQQGWSKRFGMDGTVGRIGTLGTLRQINSTSTFALEATLQQVSPGHWFALDRRGAGGRHPVVRVEYQ